MGRSGALFMGICFSFASVIEVTAQEAESPAFWDGFYLGILGGTAHGLAPDVTGSGTVAPGADWVTNQAFYYGPEAFLAAHSASGGDQPFLWLEADGRLGPRLTKQMLLSTSAGTGYDAGEPQLALTGAAATDLALNQGMAVRAEHSLAPFLAGGNAAHDGAAGVVFQPN